MQLVYIKNPELADKLRSYGYKPINNTARQPEGVFCFEATRKQIEMLEAEYNKADYLIDPLNRYQQTEANEK